MKECVNCKATLEDDELFCHECGTKQVIEQSEAQAEEQSVPEGMKCSHCGETIEEDSLFCPYCGKTQDVEKTKNEEPQPEAEEAEPKQEKPKAKEEPKVEESPKEEPKEPQQEVSQPEEEPTYEYEEEKKSKTWLWILILFLLVGGGVWYFWGTNLVEPQLDSDVNKENEEESKLMEENREKEEMLAFVKDFYVHYNEDGFIYENVTETTIKQLRRDYPYYCEEDDCLATWVFSAYPAGTDMNLEVGPIIVQVSNGSVFDVSFKYSYMDNGIKKYEEREIRLYVGKVGDRYKISCYDYNDESQASRHDEDKRINRIPEGKYNLWLADMHMFIEVHDSIVEGYYYFKAGTSQTTNIDFEGKADNGLKLHLKQWSVSGKDLGYIDGTFDGKTFKGECDTDKGYRKEFELYVGGD